jgi:hypothetical protein
MGPEIDIITELIPDPGGAGKVIESRSVPALVSPHYADLYKRKCLLVRIVMNLESA